MARLFFINRYYHPDHSATAQLLADLTSDLAARGRAVTVVTSRQRYDDPAAALPRFESVHGVDIIRVRTSRFGRGRLAGRALDYLSFYLAVAWHLMRQVQPGDTVVFKTDPPMLSGILWPIVRLRRAMIANWLHDLFPEIAAALGVRGVGGLSGRMLQRLRNRGLRAARLNVAIGQQMAERLSALGIDGAVRVIPNWADCRQVRPVPHADNALRKQWGLDSKFAIVYSGNLGRAHLYRPLLDAMAALRERTDIELVFIGGGAQTDAARLDARQMGLPNVSFRPYQPRERLAASLSLADLHVISLKPELEGMVVPSKYYGIAAAGRPCLFVGDPDGEIGRLVREHATGIACPPDGGLIRTAILELADDAARRQRMGARARALAELRFDRAICSEIWFNALNELEAADMMAHRDSTGSKPDES